MAAFSGMARGPIREATDSATGLNTESGRTRAAVDAAFRIFNGRLDNTLEPGDVSDRGLGAGTRRGPVPVDGNRRPGAGYDAGYARPGVAAVACLLRPVARP